MRNIFAAVSLATLCIVLLTLGLSAQSNLPDFPDLLDTPRHVQVTIPPFELPTGTVITVTTTSDDMEDNGNCTLREAIQAANTDTAVDGCPAGDGEDLIVLAAGTYGLSIEGRSEDDNLTGDLDIRSSLVISGVGAEKTVLDANQIDRVLHVHKNMMVTSSGVTLQNGKPASCGLYVPLCEVESGGGVYNAGELTIFSSNITTNGAAVGSNGHKGGSGGGIYTTGSLAVISSTLTYNHAGDDLSAGGSSGDGGGIANMDGTVLLIASTLSDNSAGGPGDPPKGPAIEGGNGGGILNSGVLNITGSVIANNSLHSGGDGGGIFNKGYAVISSTDIHHNGPNASFGLISSGGGIYNTGTLSLTSSVIRDNFTGEGVSYILLPSPVREIPGGAGGGLANDAGTVMIDQVTISGNRTGNAGSGPRGGSGGGLATWNEGNTNIQNSTIAYNVTGSQVDYPDPDHAGKGQGDGISGPASVYNTILSNNADGEGIDCHGSILLVGHSLVTNPGQSCTISEQTATNIVYRSAWLAPLADNGGPTPTHALLPQSPALNNGSCTTYDDTPITEDQRGEPRPQGQGCDIGAYESDLEYVPPEELFLPVIKTNNE